MFQEGLIAQAVTDESRRGRNDWMAEVEIKLMFYLILDMARAAELPRPPYKNLATYHAYKKAPD